MEFWAEPQDENEYSEQILSDIRNEEITVFSTVFSPCGSYLVGGSIHGDIAIWHLDGLLVEDCWKKNERPDINPILKFSVTKQKQDYSPGSVYSLLFTGSGDNSVLVAGHDKGVSCWRWSELAAIIGDALSSQNMEEMMEVDDTQAITPCIEMACPQHIGYLGARSPLAEVNGVAAAGGPGGGGGGGGGGAVVYGAAGDGRAYAWDLAAGQVVAKYEGHQGYLHCVGFSASKQALVTGSEDGQIGIWDVRSAKTVDFVPMKDSGAQKRKGLHAWVGALQVDEEGHFAVCGGGREKGGFLQTEGWLGAVALGARCAVGAGRTAPAPVQSLAWWDGDLVAGGACAALGVYDRLATKKSSRCAVSPASVFSVAAQQQGPGGEGEGLCCAAGAGAALDVFVHRSARAFALRFQ